MCSTIILNRLSKLYSNFRFYPEDVCEHISNTFSQESISDPLIYLQTRMSIFEYKY